MQKNLIVNSADWAECLDVPSMYKVLYGGRGGGKTTEIAQALILRGTQRRLRVMCCRQFQNSIEESVKPALEKAIIEMGLEDYYIVQEKRILCPMTNTVFRFKGLERNIMSIKGWEDYDIIWAEEANTVRAAALELLIPTVRKAGSEIWFSLNRHKRTDPVDKMFLGKSQPTNSIIIKVGWQDNPFFTKELNSKRLDDFRDRPERYKHIWGGEPDDNSDSSILLPMDKLLLCVDAHKKLGWKPTGRRHGGLDVADSPEGDYNAMVKRQGPLVYSVERWHAKYLHITADRAHHSAINDGLMRLYYDASGLGAGIKSEFAKKGRLSYGVKPFRFGDAVAGPNTVYIKTGEKPVYNKDAFVRRNAQAGWNIKLRMERTVRALGGEDIDLNTCLFFDGSMKDIDEYLLELSQPVFDYDTADKIRLDKDPDDNGSPDMYDSTVMAFAFDTRRGLKANDS